MLLPITSQSTATEQQNTSKSKQTEQTPTENDDVTENTHSLNAGVEAVSLNNGYINESLHTTSANVLPFRFVSCPNEQEPFICKEGRCLRKLGFCFNNFECRKYENELHACECTEDYQCSFHTICIDMLEPCGLNEHCIVEYRSPDCSRCKVPQFTCVNNTCKRYNPPVCPPGHCSYEGIKSCAAETTTGSLQPIRNDQPTPFSSDLNPDNGAGYVGKNSLASKAFLLAIFYRVISIFYSD